MNVTEPFDWHNFDQFENGCYDEISCNNHIEPDHSPEMIRKMKQLQVISDVVILLIACVSILLNSAVIVLYIWMGKPLRKKIPTFMLFNQAIVDLLIGAYAIITTIPNFVLSLGGKYPYAIIAFVMGHYTVFLALGILVLISVERFLALCKPLYHRQVVTKCRMRVGVLTVWVFSFIPCAIYVSNVRRDGIVYKENFYTYYNSTRISITLFGLLFVLALLLWTLRTARHSIKAGISRASVRKSSNQKCNFMVAEQKKERKIVKIFISMATLYTISYLPTAVFTIVQDFADLKMSSYNEGVTHIVVFISYISSALFNPILTLTLQKRIWKDSSLQIMLRRASFSRNSSRSERVQLTEV